MLSIITINTEYRQVSSFCTDPKDYECKTLGITKCIPRLNRSSTDKFLPIEKPSCAVNCPDEDSWCEERGACIDQDEQCDCGYEKIYCTGSNTYSCESRQGILQSHIFNICRDGTCRMNCSASKDSECRGGQFNCGNECVDKGRIMQLKSCNGQCISVHKTCLSPRGGVSRITWNKEIGLWGGIILIIRQGQH